MSSCCINQHNTQNTSVWCDQCESLQVGARIGDFTVHSFVGHGSTSAIYLASQQSLNNRKVVIKVLQPMESQESINVFQREAALLAALVHPYIVPIYAHGIIPESRVLRSGVRVYSPYLVLPYAEQGALDVQFAREGNKPWSLQRVLPIIEEAAEALSYAHSKGILHRDIKPANMLMIGSHVVLSDFGVAALIAIDSSHLNADWAGSPAYMAPEVWRLRPGRYSDQYALAVTSFRLLSGVYPWPVITDSMQGWLRLHQHVEPRLLSECRPDLPMGVSMVLQRALAKEPHERYPDVLAFASDLRVAAERTQSLHMPVVRRTRVIAEKQMAISLEATPQGYDRAPRKSPERYAPPVQSMKLSPETPQLPLLIEEEKQFHPEAHALHATQVSKGAEAEKISPAPEPAMLANWLQQEGEGDLSIDEYRTMPELGRMNTSLIEDMKPDLWTWRACWLHILLYAVLAAAAWYSSRNILVGLILMLCLWPGLLIGPLVARSFRRVSLSSLPWGIVFGMLYGLVTVTVSTLVCYSFSALIYTVLNQKVWPLPDYGWHLFVGQVIALAPHALIIFLVSLWCIVFGGALIGLLAARSEQVE